MSRLRTLGALGAGLVVFAIATSAQAADFYVDPAQGSPQGDGSAAQPWRTLQEVMEANLVETQEWDQLPYSPSSQLVPKNARAPVKAGDTIWLRSGYHGEVLIERSYNASVITIAAEAGQTPELKSLHLRAAGHWTVRGLSISPEFASPYEAGASGSAATPESEGDCGCRTVGPAKGQGPALGLLLLLAVGARRGRGRP